MSKSALNKRIAKTAFNPQVNLAATRFSSTLKSVADFYSEAKENLVTDSDSNRPTFFLQQRDELARLQKATHITPILRGRQLEFTFVRFPAENEDGEPLLDEEGNQIIVSAMIDGHTRCAKLLGLPECEGVDFGQTVFVSVHDCASLADAVFLYNQIDTSASLKLGTDYLSGAYQAVFNTPRPFKSEFMRKNSQLTALKILTGITGAKKHVEMVRQAKDVLIAADAYFVAKEADVFCGVLTKHNSPFKERFKSTELRALTLRLVEFSQQMGQKSRAIDFLDAVLYSKFDGIEPKFKDDVKAAVADIIQIVCEAKGGGEKAILGRVDEAFEYYEESLLAVSKMSQKPVSVRQAALKFFKKSA